MTTARTSSRRDFLRRTTTAAAGIAVLPRTGLERLNQSVAVTPMPIAPARPELRAGVCIVRFDGREARPLYEALYRDHRIAAAPTGGLRFSPHIYNTMQDVETALAAVRSVIRT
jgi:selenocysteine lyase/cysteine desulfurase